MRLCFVPDQQELTDEPGLEWGREDELAADGRRPCEEIRVPVADDDANFIQRERGDSEPDQQNRNQHD